MLFRAALAVSVFVTPIRMAPAFAEPGPASAARSQAAESPARQRLVSL